MKSSDDDKGSGYRKLWWIVPLVLVLYVLSFVVYLDEDGPIGSQGFSMPLSYGCAKAISLRASGSLLPRKLAHAFASVFGFACWIGGAGGYCRDASTRPPEMAAGKSRLPGRQIFLPAATVTKSPLAPDRRSSPAAAVAIARSPASPAPLPLRCRHLPPPVQVNE